MTGEFLEDKNLNLNLARIVPIYSVCEDLSIKVLRRAIYNAIQTYKNEIENIVIQGHTDSQSFAGIKNSDVQYMKNMELSLQRANSVASYMFNTKIDEKYNKKLKKILVVEGKSYSEPILTNGKEDFNKSRRVEMRLKVRKLDITDIFFNGIQHL